MKKSSIVGKRSIENGLGAAGVGYVVIPSNVDRDDYIKHCFKNKTVCLKTEDFEFLKDVPVGENELQKLKFPSDERNNGSVVGWVKMSKSGQPMVVTVFGLKNDGNDTENDAVFHLFKSFKSRHVTVKGDTDKGTLVLGVQGDAAAAGKLSIRVTNAQANSDENELDVYVQGTATLKAEKDLLLEAENSFIITIRDRTKGKQGTVISYKLGEGLSVEDEFGNSVRIDKSGVDIQTTQTKIRNRNRSTQPVALANETNAILKDLMGIMEKQNAMLLKLGQTDAAALTTQLVTLRTKLEKTKSKTLQSD